MPCAAVGLRQIDTAEQQHEFFVAEGDFVFFALCLRPPKASLLQSLGAYPKAAAVPEEQFQPVALRIGEQKDMTAQRIARQPVAHQPEETFKALAHVGRSGGKIDTRGWSDAEHDQASSTVTELAQRAGIETALHFNAESAVQNHGQFTAAGAGSSDFYRDKPLRRVWSSPGRLFAIASHIAGRASLRADPLPTELRLTHAARFVLNY